MTEAFIISGIFFIGFAIFCTGAWITTEIYNINQKLDNILNIIQNKK